MLPNDESDIAKDLGVFNIANPLPQSIAPAIAPFLAIGAPKNCASLFVVAALFAAVAAFAISLIWAVQ